MSQNNSDEQSYDGSAELYDAAFQDIKVRKIEWDYVTDLLKQFHKTHGYKPTVVEVGCGNGQMLKQLSYEGYITSAIGYDASLKMVGIAASRYAEVDNLSFQYIEHSELPLPSSSVDIVISFMSYRYLDWKPFMAEVDRVLIDQGKFIMVDMATTELHPEDLPLYEDTKRRTEELHACKPEFAANLKKLVDHPEWKTMLKHHPRRLASEYENFLTARYPKANWERLYVCFDHSLFGFHYIKS